MKMFMVPGNHPHEAKLHQNIKKKNIIDKININKKIIGIGETDLIFTIIIRIKKIKLMFRRTYLCSSRKTCQISTLDQQKRNLKFYKNI